MIPLFFFGMMALTALQVLVSCEVEMFDLFYHHRFDHLEKDTHQWHVDLYEMLVDDEHPLGEYHEHIRNDPRMKRDGKYLIHELVESHWQVAALWWVVHLNLTAILTFLLRYYFYFARKTFMVFLLIMIVIVVSTLFQLAALGIRVALLFYEFSVIALFALGANFVILLLEIETLYDINNIRNLTIILASEFASIPREISEELYEKDKNGDVKVNTIFDSIFCCISNFKNKKDD